jgi:2-methylcitrate dehydratase PrpD
MDGTVTPTQFDDDHLRNPELRALLQKIEVVSNPEFTAAYERLPVEHRTRVTAVTQDGKSVQGVAGGDQGDLSEAKSDAQIEAKFCALTESALSAKRVRKILDRLWNLDDTGNIANIPPAFVL